MLDFHGMLRKSSHQPHRESQIQKTRSRHQNETWWAGNCQRMLSSGAWIDTISFHIPEVAQLHHCRHRTQPSHSWKYFQRSIIVLIYHLLILLFVYLYDGYLMRYLLAIRVWLQFKMFSSYFDHISYFHLNQPTTILIGWILFWIIWRYYSPGWRIGHNEWLILSTRGRCRYASIISLKINTIFDAIFGVVRNMITCKYSKL